MDNISHMFLYAKDLSQKVTNGYLTDMEYPVGLEWTFIPKSTGGSTSTYYCDWFTTHDSGEENIVLAGAALALCVACWACVLVLLLCCVVCRFGCRCSLVLCSAISKIAQKANRSGNLIFKNTGQMQN